MKLYIIVLFFFCFALNAQVPDTIRNSNRYGAFANYGYNIFVSDFGKLPGIPNCCPRFTDGYGNGFTFGFLYDYLIDETYFQSFRIGYVDLSGIAKDLEKTYVIPNGTTIEGEFEHILESSISALFFEPNFNVNLFKNINLILGINISYLFKNDFYQYEKISKPERQGTFLDSLGNDTFKRTRNELDGEIPQINKMLFSALLGISMDLKLNKSATLFLVPELFYHYGFSNVVNSLDWQINTLKFGIALKYKKSDEIKYIEEYKEQILIDTIQVVSNEISTKEIRFGKTSTENTFNYSGAKRINITSFLRTDTLLLPQKYELECDINAFGIDSSNIQIPNPKLTIEEFVAKRLDPLLNYIFFDEDSYNIPQKYKHLGDSEVFNFNEEMLYTDSTLGIYYQILNIVGSRLKKEQSAKLTIIGCNSNTNNEKGNLKLSQLRAESVKKYLQDMWSINDNRLIIQTKNLPAKASLPFDEPDKMAENRRVEFYSDNYNILKPVFTTDTAIVINFDKLLLKPEIKSEAGIKNYDVKLFLNDNSLIFSSSKSKVEDEFVNLDKSLKKIKYLNSQIFYGISAYDLKNQNSNSAIKQIPLELISLQKKRENFAVDYEINKFSLILFEFNMADISGKNAEIINLINNIIQKDSEVEITGYTDRTGNDDYNLKLSEKRALATKSILKSNNANAKGIGETTLIYNNDIPEGRFYCRTVEIMVKTKVK